MSIRSNCPSALQINSLHCNIQFDLICFKCHYLVRTHFGSILNVLSINGLHGKGTTYYTVSSTGKGCSNVQSAIQLMLHTTNRCSRYESKQTKTLLGKGSYYCTHNDSLRVQYNIFKVLAVQSLVFSATPVQ